MHALKIKTYYFAGPRRTFEAYAAPTIVLIFNTVFNVMFMLFFFVRVEREESARDEFVVSICKARIIIFYLLV